MTEWYEHRTETGGSFETLYRKHFSAVYRFLYRLTGDREEAMDATQDTFVKLYRFLKKGRSLREPKAWIFKVAANTCYTLFKRARHFREIVAAGTVDPPFSVMERSAVEAQLIREQETKRVRQALMQLPLRDRLLLELHSSGLSYDEIAAAANVKSSTIGKKLFRTRLKLKTLLKNQTPIQKETSTAALCMAAVKINKEMDDELPQ